MTAERVLAQGVEQLKIKVDFAEQQKMLKYLGLLQKWNKVYNLTAIREPERMVSHHLLDSLAILPHLWPGRWLDVGCGPGLPGLILAIMRSDWSFTLLDSNSKKTSFVQQAVLELGLQNVSVCCARVEEWRAEERFDGIVSRAFAEVGLFTENTRHLLAKEGCWAAMKGEPGEELAKLPEGIKLERIIPLQVPMLDAKRCLVVLKAV